MENAFFDTSVFELTQMQWWALAPYLWLSLGIALATIAAGFRAPNGVLKILAVVVLVPFIGCQFMHVNSEAQSIFGSSLEVNAWVRVVGAGLGVFAFLAAFFTESHDEGGHPEWLPLLFIALLGMAILPATRDWAAFFIALETLAICGYVLTALNTEKEHSLEAGLKYLLMGSFASALFLMGVACLYGVSGSLDFEKIKEISSQINSSQLIFVMAGMILVLTSLAFKVALFPFHMWAPDVYQAAPSGAAAFLASATKLSVFAAMALAFEANGFFAYAPVKQALAVLGTLSVIIGSVLAISQQKLRRLLAYSSIVSAGYGALALASGFKAMAGLITFLIFYGLSVICAFAVVENFLKVSENKNLDDVSLSDLPGIAKATPLWLLACFALAVFSMAGIPPLPGFVGKYLILKDLVANRYFVSAAVLLMGSLLGLAYYLRILVPLYMDNQGEALFAPRKISISGAFAALASIVVMFYCLSLVGRIGAL